MMLPLRYRILGNFVAEHRWRVVSGEQEMVRLAAMDWSGTQLGDLGFLLPIHGLQELYQTRAKLAL